MQALLLIFFSEIGDKTFFIALLLALQQPRALVFAGAPAQPLAGRLAACVGPRCPFGRGVRRHMPRCHRLQ